MRIYADIVDIPTAATRVQVLNTKDRVLHIRFKALAANAGIVYVGDSTVSATQGYPLSAGQDVSLDMRLLGGSVLAETLYADAASNGDDIGFIAILE